MPLHEEIVDFSKELVKFLPDYEIVSEHIPSRVIMFAKKKFKIDGLWHTWIDFEKWHRLVNADGRNSEQEDSALEFTSLDYLKRTPQVGLSGKGTLVKIKPETSAKAKIGNGNDHLLVDEKTEEMDFYGEPLLKIT